MSKASQVRPYCSSHPHAKTNRSSSHTNAKMASRAWNMFDISRSRNRHRYRHRPWNTHRNWHSHRNTNWIRSFNRNRYANRNPNRIRHRYRNWIRFTYTNNICLSRLWCLCNISRKYRSICNYTCLIPMNLCIDIVVIFY